MYNTYTQRVLLDGTPAIVVERLSAIIKLLAWEMVDRLLLVCIDNTKPYIDQLRPQRRHRYSIVCIVALFRWSLRFLGLKEFSMQLKDMIIEMMRHDQ